MIVAAPVGPVDVIWRVMLYCRQENRKQQETFFFFSKVPPESKKTHKKEQFKNGACLFAFSIATVDYLPTKHNQFGFLHNANKVQESFMCFTTLTGQSLVIHPLHGSCFEYWNSQWNSFLYDGLDSWSNKPCYWSDHDSHAKVRRFLCWANPKFNMSLSSLFISLTSEQLDRSKR